MRHTVEIADSDGDTMQLVISVDSVGYGGSWRAIDKGYLSHNSGPVNQYHKAWQMIFHVELLDGNSHYGVRLYDFIGTWGFVNDQGSGTLLQNWAVSLTPGDIEWSLV